MLASFSLALMVAAQGVAKAGRARPRTASRFNGPPLFVSGCNRGGTTILTHLLAAHPELRSIGRGPFNEGLHVWRRHFPDRTRHRWAVPPWRWLMRRTETHATPMLADRIRSDFEAALPGPGRMLEKTPANAVRIPFINRLYPDCTFIHVLRDGRHTTASLVARRVWLPYAPHQWVGAHRTALEDLAALPSERVVIVRYEALMADPEPVLEDLCYRCGLDWDRGARADVLEAVRHSLRPQEDRWSRFAPYHKRYVLSVIGDLQSELGYPLET
jgi:hypothetical protein